MDMQDILDFVQRQIAENDPERQKPPMDHVLSLSGARGGGFAGPSEGGFGMRLDDREEPPHLWAVSRRRVALSCEPWVVDLLARTRSIVDLEERRSPRGATGASRCGRWRTSSSSRRASPRSGIRTTHGRT